MLKSFGLCLKFKLPFYQPQQQNHFTSAKARRALPSVTPDSNQELPKKCMANPEELNVHFEFLFFIDIANNGITIRPQLRHTEGGLLGTLTRPNGFIGAGTKTTKYPYFTFFTLSLTAGNAGKLFVGLSK
jgi:hypothetical protein